MGYRAMSLVSGIVYPIHIYLQVYMLHFFITVLEKHYLAQSNPLVRPICNASSLIIDKGLD